MILGSYLSRLWPILFGLSIFFKRKKLSIIFIITFILSEVLIFISGDKFIFINFSAFLFYSFQKLSQIKIAYLISSIFLIIIITFINPRAKKGFGIKH